MDILAFRPPETTIVEPEWTIVAHADGLTAISRRWAEGVLDADPCCRRCSSRGPVTCLALATRVILDERAAELYSECKADCRPAARRGRRGG